MQGRICLNLISFGKILFVDFTRKFLYNKASIFDVVDATDR